MTVMAAESFAQSKASTAMDSRDEEGETKVSTLEAWSGAMWPWEIAEVGTVCCGLWAKRDQVLFFTRGIPDFRFSAHLGPVMKNPLLMLFVGQVGSSRSN